MPYSIRVILDMPVSPPSGGYLIRYRLAGSQNPWSASIPYANNEGFIMIEGLADNQAYTVQATASCDPSFSNPIQVTHDSFCNGCTTTMYDLFLCGTNTDANLRLCYPGQLDPGEIIMASNGLCYTVAGVSNTGPASLSITNTFVTCADCLEAVNTAPVTPPSQTGTLIAELLDISTSPEATVLGVLGIITSVPTPPLWNISFSTDGIDCDEYDLVLKKESVSVYTNTRSLTFAGEALVSYSNALFLSTMHNETFEPDLVLKNGNYTLALTFKKNGTQVFYKLYNFILTMGS
jgi:hypothetical protein